MQPLLTSFVECKTNTDARGVFSCVNTCQNIVGQFSYMDIEKSKSAVIVKPRKQRAAVLVRHEINLSESTCLVTNNGLLNQCVTIPSPVTQGLRSVLSLDKCVFGSKAAPRRQC